MGRTVKVYRKLGQKLDGMTARVPWNESLYQVLKELYTEEEADLVARMPYLPSRLERIAGVSGYEPSRLRGLLERLADKGLVVDMFDGQEYRYVVSPMVIGVFEFTMMRTGPVADAGAKRWAELFHAYMAGSDQFYRANFGAGQRISIARALPHRGTVDPAVEILPYEKVEAVVNSQTRFAIGLCSCRHEKLHTGLKTCEVPLESCSSFGESADYLIRHRMAREVDRQEMLANLERSRELGLVFSADAVREDVSFICSCCSCCCNILYGLRRFGYSNVLMTSSFVAAVNEDRCIGCGKCAGACPIGVIDLEVVGRLPSGKDKKRARVDASVCLGCGVCALQCRREAMRLHQRVRTVLHPENSLERIILAALERGNLQNFIFDIPDHAGHRVMRALVGTFLRLPPVKRALMSDALRSRFLAAAGAS